MPDTLSTLLQDAERHRPLDTVGAACIGRDSSGVTADIARRRVSEYCRSTIGIRGDLRGGGFVVSRGSMGTADLGSSSRWLALIQVDLLYIHWPAVTGQDDRYDPNETIRAFDELLDDGRIRNVGVANFSVGLVEEAREYSGSPILANQVEMHPLLQQRELRTFARDIDMYLVAYCPLMRGSIGGVPELQEIAGKYDATPGQVSLAWLTSKDCVVPIPKSGGIHIRENYRVRDLDLHPSDLNRIDAIDREERVVDPGKGPWNW